MRLPAPAFFAAALLLSAIPAPLAAGDAADYTTQIKPLVKSHCQACHGALKQEGNLRLDTAAAMRKGGDSGPAVVAGNAAASLLIVRIAATDEASRMPQEGKPLTAEQVELVRRWIDSGAASPAGEQPEPDPRAHWAFQLPVRPQPPVGAVAGSQPIDAFIHATLAERGLAAVGPAPPEIQLRRLFLDLVGLPPTRDELHAFLADDRPDAFERVADRLLASPQHGERWARHWMDVWRYSDWYGRRAVPDVMNSYPQIWRWRDWIVRSLNADRGYDQMILEMLAADELWPEDQQRIVATGFIVRNWFKWNYDTWMRDQVEHTGKAFLGLTFQCALCHDHKYDPITQDDYFRLRAIFEPLELRHERVPGQTDPGPFKKYVYAESYGPIATGMIRVMDEKLDAQTFVYRGGDQRNKIEGRPAMPPGMPAILGGERLAVQPIELPPLAYYPGLRPGVQNEERARCASAVAAAEQSLVAARPAAEAARIAAEQANPFDETAAKALAVAEWSLAAAEAAVASARSDQMSLEARIVAATANYFLKAGDGDALSKDAAAAERQAKLATASRQRTTAALALAQAEAAPADEKRAVAIAAALKGLVTAEQAVVTAQSKLANNDATYSPLSQIYPAQSTGRRAALARWIASRENPLTARVAVNHLWRWHFGRPLVETTANFGRNGKAPSHPKLLDWLAVELMDGGWNMKRLHRRMVASDAYRRASEMTNDQAPRTNQIQSLESELPNLADPDNIFLWRTNAQRMDAEVIRDSLLAVAGQLDTTIGGPEIDHAQGLTSARRSLYFAHHGESKMELLELFDGASAMDCYERTTSIRPQQALAMANSELTRASARRLADKLGAESPDEAFAAAAFEHALSRSATSDELAAAVKFLSEQPASGRQSLIHVLLNHHDFVTIR
jgi:mono/diheme cytochrome c family protein